LIKGQSLLEPNVQRPIGREVVFIAEALAAMQTETGKWHPSSIFLEDDAAQISNPIGRAKDKEAVEMFAAPIEGTLKNFVEFGDAGVACHEQTPPYQRTHAAKYDAKLVDSDG
jgi:hypothetical protein